MDEPEISPFSASSAVPSEWRWCEMSPLGSDPVASWAWRTAAPAPSAKMIAVDRSFWSTQSDSFSAPISRTLRAAPEVIAEAAVDSP